MELLTRNGVLKWVHDGVCNSSLDLISGDHSVYLFNCRYSADDSFVLLKVTASPRWTCVPYPKLNLKVL